MTRGNTCLTLDRAKPLVGEIRRGAAALRPNPETTEVLRATKLLAILGPLAVGKTALMRAVVDYSPAFGRVQGFTTRPQRRNEPHDTYHWVSHNRQGLHGILGMMQQGEVVEVAVHPTTDYVYGSSRLDYAQPYSMLDTLTTAVPDIERLPFGGIVRIGLVAPPEDWKCRFEQRRLESSPADMHKRLQEGAESMRWLLGQEEGAAHVVVNRNGGLYDAAGMVVDLARGEGQASPNGREVGEALLASIEQHLLADSQS